MLTDSSARAIGVIPARMGSSRFPGKPLASLLGMPMVGHCLRRSSMASSLSEVIVATCDEDIASYTRELGGRAIMTSSAHETASDRTAEAVQILEDEVGAVPRVVVMIQGDEPLVRPEMIDDAVAAIEASGAPVANLCARISAEESRDPNEIKVVMDERNRALFMSRGAIPYDRDGVEPARYKQVCIIPFRRDFLSKFNALPRTPLEMAESIDMLRAIEHGYEVTMVRVEAPMQSVDTIDDLRRAEFLLQRDDLAAHYL